MIDNLYFIFICIRDGNNSITKPIILIKNEEPSSCHIYRNIISKTKTLVYFFRYKNIEQVIPYSGTTLCLTVPFNTKSSPYEKEIR